MASGWKIPHLPDDIVESILLELPVKSLLRFKSSCKSWCCSINDPDFTKSHLHKSSADISLQKVLFVTFEKFSPFTILSNDKIGSAEASLTVDSKVMLLDPPIQGFLNDISAGLKVSSCNGLVFIKNDTSMMLWNPAIRKYKLIPSYNMPSLFWTYSLFGIAYDSLAEDYKVVHVKVIDESHQNHIVEIFSAINQSWRMMEDSRVPVGFRSMYQHPVSLSGTVNLIVRGNDSECFVMSLDLSDEKFIVTPAPIKDGSWSSWRLCTFANHVCTSRTLKGKFSIWELEKNAETGLLTWINIIKLLTPGSLIQKSPQGLVDFIYVKENGNILWRNFSTEHGCFIGFIEYDVRRKEFNEFKPELEISMNIHLPLLHVESLASPAIILVPAGFRRLKGN
ncbi:hypothetical protein BC332_06855 [Capsicum chinense]|nr:hypothetical protein BC332_06855 [Capsicum chinense]